MSEQKPTVEEVIKNSNLSESLQEAHIQFCRFLEDNGFSIEPEGHTEGNTSGWMITYESECVGHTNYADVGVWIDACDFGGGDSAEDAVKELTWAHVRGCEHFNSGGKKCGCGNQPGFEKTIFGRKFDHLCFAAVEFMNPDAKTLGDIERLLLLFKQDVCKPHG